MSTDQTPRAGNLMADADERAQSQAEGADKRADGFTRMLLVADVRGQIGTANFETRCMAIATTDDVRAALGVRPIVAWWAILMEQTLRRNEGPPKHKGPWGLLPSRTAAINTAFAGLQRERLEVITDLQKGNDPTLELVDESCAAMILADYFRVGGPSRDRGWTL